MNEKLLALAENLASMNRGELTSKCFGNREERLSWKCEKGHVWERRLSSVEKGRWCDYCDVTTRLGKAYSEVLKIASEFRGKLVSKLESDMFKSKIPIEWECEKKHSFSRKLFSVKYNKQWCSICENLRKYQELSDIASSRGGKLLSSEFTKLQHNYLWECKHNHTWVASGANVKHRLSWCPTCVVKKGQRICKAYFEQIYKERFDTVRPNWLIGPTGKPLELDGFCEKLKIAFEHQGTFHYEDKFHNSYKYGKVRCHDEIKKNLCEKNEVILVQIPEVPSLTSLKELREIIKETCPSRLKSDLDFDIAINLDEVFTPHDILSLERLKDIAKNKGGLLLSTHYFGMRSKYLWRCAKGHEWLTTGDTIRNSWCSKCKKNSSG